jgi:aconitase B
MQAGITLRDLVMLSLLCHQAWIIDRREKIKINIFNGRFGNQRTAKHDDRHLLDASAEFCFAACGSPE